MESRSAVILAGGRGRRIGVDKATLEIGGRPLIEIVASTVRKVAGQVVVVARNESQKTHLEGLLTDRLTNIDFAVDEVQNCGPVAGLAAGMAVARGELSLAVGCDHPFLCSEVLDELYRLADGHDAAIPVSEDGILETLHAVYRSETMAEACCWSLEKNLRKIVSPLGALNINQVSAEKLRSMDPCLLSFFNLNTLEDLDLALKISESYRF